MNAFENVKNLESVSLEEFQSLLEQFQSSKKQTLDILDRLARDSMLSIFKHGDSSKASLLVNSMGESLRQASMIKWFSKYTQFTWDKKLNKFYKDQESVNIGYRFDQAMSEHWSKAIPAKKEIEETLETMKNLGKDYMQKLEKKTSKIIALPNIGEDGVSEILEYRRRLREMNRIWNEGILIQEPIQEPIQETIQETPKKQKKSA